ncbi:MAG: hypothetical protein AAFR15_00395 [Cyanobacteria bacterium J06627_15]
MSGSSSLQSWGILAGLATLGGVAAIPVAVVAQAFPPCPPPAAGEYLLLARGSTEADRDQIASVIPAANPVLVCQYVDDVVVRAGGFDNLEAANSWALYLRDIEGFETFVAQPAAATEPVPQELAYQPQALGAGYAVLIDYDNEPAIAAAAAATLNQPIGLAVYRQQPYLLASYTSDAGAAAAVLQQLTAADLNAVLVDSQQVVRLLETVAIE